MDYQQLLDDLTDAQLMELMARITEEGFRRQLDKKFQRIVIDEQQKAKIATAAYEAEYNKAIAKEAEKIAEAAREKARKDAAASLGIEEPEDEQTVVWKRKKSVELALDIIGFNTEEKNWCVTIWNKTDKRVYFQDANFGKNYATYYQNGNQFHPPGDICFEDNVLKKLLKSGIKLDKHKKSQFKVLLAKIGEFWSSEIIDDRPLMEFEQWDDKHLSAYKQAIESVK